MNIGRIFANAIARRVAYVLVAAVVAWLGIGSARASSYSDMGTAYAACMADRAAAIAAGTARAGNTCTRTPSQGTQTGWNCSLIARSSGTPRACRYFITNPRSNDTFYTFPGTATCATRADEYGWQAPGGTAAGSVCSQGCAYDYVLDVAGNFYAPNGNWCDTSQSEEPVLDTDQDGVPDDLDAFPADPNESQDSDGDGIGDNADFAPDDPTNGDDKSAPDEDNGERDNIATGGGDCNAPPQCSGDGIQCAQLYQLWRLNCKSATVTGDPTVCAAAYTCNGDSVQCAQVALLRKNACEGVTSGDGSFGAGDKANLQAIKDAITGEGESLADVEVPWSEAGEGVEPWESGLGGGSCPAPISQTVEIAGYSASFELSFDPMCQFAAYIKAIVMAMAAVTSAYILAGVRR